MTVTTRNLESLLGVRRFAAGPPRDRGLQVAEHFKIDVVRRAVIRQQILQSFFVVFRLGQLEDWFMQVSGKPDYGSANQRFVPIDRPQQPGTLAAR